MLDYSKKVLEKVSFNQELFEKELKKTLQWLNEQEADVLMRWCSHRFGAQYAEILNKTFAYLNYN